MESLPEVIQDLIRVLTCDYMGLTLSNMTGLALHSSVDKHAKTSKDEESDSSSVNESDDSDVSDEETDESKGENSKKKRKIDNEDSNETNSQAHSSKAYSVEASEKLYKKFKVSHEYKHEKKESSKATEVNTGPCSSKSEQVCKPSDRKLKEVLSEMPKCYFEVRRWKEGSYTLVNDDDEAIKTQALDLMIFFDSKSWSLEMGGNVSYIARDEDTELLTVSPEDENCISLVYR